MKQIVLSVELNMNTPQKVLGIDYGSKRIGLSTSDPLGILATPYGTIANDATLWDRLKEIVKKESIGSIVVGMPLTLRGESGQKAKEVEGFIHQLKLETGIIVFSRDERFTTAMAQQTLVQMNTKKKNRNAKDGTLDSMAAAILLQEYLDSKKNSITC